MTKTDRLQSPNCTEKALLRARKKGPPQGQQKSPSQGQKKGPSQGQQHLRDHKPQSFKQRTSRYMGNKRCSRYTEQHIHRNEAFRPEKAIGNTVPTA